MHTMIDLLKRNIDGASSVGGVVDAAHRVAQQAGFGAMIYDFSPVATTSDGMLVIPSHLCHRDAPADMRQLWCDQKYHQHDEWHFDCVGAYFILTHLRITLI